MKRSHLMIGAILLTAMSWSQPSDTREFPATQGDLLVIHNEVGRIIVRGSSSGMVRAQIRRSPPADSRADDLLLVAGKTSTAIELRAIFPKHAPWPVDFDVEVPSWMNLTVWSSRAEVVLKDLRGTVRVETHSGSVRAENLSGAVSLATGAGAIDYASGVQPIEDIQLSSNSGDIRCQLNATLNVRALLHSGRHLTWGTEIDTTQTRLERELGAGGPLLYSASRAGKVSVSLANTVSQASTASPEIRADTIRVDVNWIYLHVSAKDPLTGVNIGGLKKDDFLVYDKGSLRTLEHFESTDAPFHLLMLLDTSGSTAPNMHLIKSAATEFAQQMRPGDRAAVAAFSHNTRLIQPFTRSREAVVAGINRISSGGATSLYDAVWMSVAEFMAGIEGRKAVVLFTDGVDNRLDGGGGSQHSFEEMQRKVQESDCLIYPIFLVPELPRVSGVAPDSNPFGINNRLGEITNRKASPELRAYQEILVTAEGQLRALAEQTGGRMYSTRRIQDLSKAYAEVTGEMRVQYTIGFHPPAGPGGEWHPLKVRLRDTPLAVVRTRAGYFTPAAR